MNESSFCFDEEQFNDLFPFFALFDKNSRIRGFGKSIAKVCAIERQLLFSEVFQLVRPSLDESSFTLDALLGQVVILRARSGNALTFRGQVAFTNDREHFLFVGTPWFGSMDDVIEHSLAIRDFAIHDPMIDLLHVLKTQEITTNEIKELLGKVNQQKNKLKTDQLELTRRGNMLEAISQATNELLSNNDFLDAVGNCLPLLGKAVGVDRIQLFNTNNSKNGRTSSLTSEWTSESWPKKDIEQKIELRESTALLHNVLPTLHKDEPYRIVSSMLPGDSPMRRVFEQEFVKSTLIVPVFHKERFWGFVRFDDCGGERKWSEAEIASLKSFSNSVSHALVRSEAEREIFDMALFVTENPDPVIRINFQGKVLLQNAAARLIDYFVVGDRKLTSEEFFLHLTEGSWVTATPNTYEAIYGDRAYLVTVYPSEQNDYINIYSSDITEKKKAESRLMESEKRMSSLVLNLQTGILVEDETRHIALCNKMFCDLFGIPAPPEALSGMDCANAAEETKMMFKDPETFVKRIDRILSDKKVVLSEQLEMVDGRTLQRDYIPIFVSDQYKGHLWKYTDITDQTNYERNLKKQEEKYRSIIENMKLGLIELDTDHKVQYANQNFCEISAYSLEELIGIDVYQYLVDEQSANTIREKNELRRKGISDSYELPVRTKLGEQKWWLISAAPNYNDLGELIGSTGIHLDITRQKMLESELRAAKSKAEESSKAKETFLANMSHEIRTPLNAIIGMVRELNKTGTTDKQQVYLKHAGSASQHLLSIINDILDISKIDAGELHLEHEKFRLKSVLDETAAIVGPLAKAKALQLTFDVDEQLASTFVGDPNRIRQILLNLVSNSIKFTEQGSVTIRCSLSGSSGDIHRVQFVVTDTGIGMEQSFLKSLFGKFTQEDRSTARKYGGTGLGMAITYELVQLMGGEIEVTSEKGAGSQFKVTIPLPTATADAELNELQAGPALLNQLSVLLVEDNELNRFVAINSLSYFGVKVTEATNGLEAIEVLKSNSFDLILMDLQMPVMGGLEATSRIRNELKLETPIIALTANAFKNEIEKCIATGMNDYITKPFEEEVLANVLSKYVRVKPAAPELPKEEAKKNGKLYDMTQMMKLSHGNDDFVLTIVKLFCSNLPDSMSAIRQSFASKDYQALKSAAHKLKPMIDNMGIRSLKEAVRQLEALDPAVTSDAATNELIERMEATLDQVVVGLKEEFRID